MGKILNNTRKQTEFNSAENPLNMQGTVSSEKLVVFDIANIIDEENVIIASGRKELPVSILSTSISFCGVRAFPYFLPPSKFSYNAARDISS